MPSLKAVVTYSSPELKSDAAQLAVKLGLEFTEPQYQNDFSLLLKLTPHFLELSLPGDTAEVLHVDFQSGAALHRYRHGGGRQQLLARAVGLHRKKNLTICDISAGLGTDAFVLASLGADVVMVERSPIIAALLEDGWRRAQQTEWIRSLAWRLVQADSREYLLSLTASQFPQIIYFDPMFPERKKSALVKKAMRLLRKVVGEDNDAPELLVLALKTARERVVVKRPRLAPPIPGPAPSFTLPGQSSRFDIYLIPKELD